MGFYEKYIKEGSSDPKVIAEEYRRNSRRIGYFFLFIYIIGAIWAYTEDPEAIGYYLEFCGIIIALVYFVVIGIYRLFKR